LHPIELTFIVLAKTGGPGSISLDDSLRSSQMVGDVNLFLSERHIDEDGEGASGDAAELIDAELEVMIAGEDEV
jgi:hypothetical protein